MRNAQSVSLNLAFDIETVGERGQILTIVRTGKKLRTPGIFLEEALKYRPLYLRCSRIILSPTG